MSILFIIIGAAVAAYIMVLGWVVHNAPTMKDYEEVKEEEDDDRAV